MKKIIWLVGFGVGVALGAALLSAVRAEPAGDCAVHLPWGAPTLSANVTPACRPGYFVLQDVANLGPRVAVERLTAEHTVGCVDRRNDFPFHKDDEVPSADPRNYTFSGYDRGHQVPAQDLAYSPETMRASMSMVNIWPQVPGLNRDGWEGLEVAVRRWAQIRGEVVVYTGPVLDSTTAAASIGRGHVTVPIAFWKVIVDPARREATAFMMGNVPIPKGDLTPFLHPVSDIELATGMTIPMPDGMDKHAQNGLWSVEGPRLAKACSVNR